MSYVHVFYSVGLTYIVRGKGDQNETNEHKAAELDIVYFKRRVALNTDTLTYVGTLR